MIWTYFAPDAAKISAHSFGSGSVDGNRSKTKRVHLFILTIEFSMKLSSKICICPIGWIIFIHKSYSSRIRIVSFPWIPHPIDRQKEFLFPCILMRKRKFSTDYTSKTYHSDPNDGTLNTPQWINIPTLLSSYHVGNERLSNEAQSGVYCCLVNIIWEKKVTAMNIHAINECILSIWKKRYLLTSPCSSHRECTHISIHWKIDIINPYHASGSTDGTLKTPQCTKMPTLTSSYHLGNGLVSSDDHSGK